MGKYGGISVKNEFVIVLISFALIQGADGIQVTASGGGNGESDSVSMNFDTLKDSAVSSQIAIKGADLTPLTTLSGSVAKFEQTHSVKDASGKSASVYVKVLNAPSGLTYTSKVLPKEGSVTTQTQVSAEQWLTVPKADSIKCTATSSYGTIRSASVGLEEARSTAAGDYVTLTGYCGKAVTTGTSVLASQTATSGAANSIKIYGSAKDSSGTYSISTPLKGISGGKATFSGLSETASAGTTTQVIQKEHLKGTFTSKATAVTKTITRSSNYGTEYDLNLAAKKSASGPTVSGIVGYYVNPTLKIQGAVNAALSGDAINVATGTYRENVKVDKSLTVKGAGSARTIVDGNKAGSVFMVGKGNANAVVRLSGMTIKNGKADYGAGIYNNGKLTVASCAISENKAWYGGGIRNYGTLTVTGSTISANSCLKTKIIYGSGGASWEYPGSGGGIYNSGIATITGSTISKNSALEDGGGIYNSGTVTITGSTLSGNSLIGSIRYNSYGGGIYNKGTMTVTSSTISGNYATHGGGIANSGTATVKSSKISGNTVKYKGGGIANYGIYKSGTFTPANLKLIDTTISSNKANWKGGGIDNTGILYVSGSSLIFSNQATIGNGGGINSEPYSSTCTVTLDGSKVKIYSNKAHLPSSITSANWYQQYGVYVNSGSPIKKNGFNPSTQVTGNTKI